MDGDLVIRKQLPLPSVPRRGRPRKYKLDEMGVGDSILIKGRSVLSVRASIYRTARRTPGKFVVIADPEGAAIWRVE